MRLSSLKMLRSCSGVKIRERPFSGLWSLVSDLSSLVSDLCFLFSSPRHFWLFDRKPGRSYALLKSGRTKMAKLALIYGMRLLPEEDLSEVRDATVVLKNGRSARVTMRLIEGSKEEIEKTFHESVSAFFEMYPEI